MNGFNYLYTPMTFPGNPFGASAGLKAKKARLEAIKSRLEGYSCNIDDKQVTNALNGSIGTIGSMNFSINGSLGSVAGDKYDEERKQEQNIQPKSLFTFPTVQCTGKYLRDEGTSGAGFC